MSVPANVPRTALTVRAPIKFKAFYRFVEAADELVEHYDWLLVTLSFLKDGSSVPVPEVAEIERAHASYAKLIERCRDDLHRYDQEDDDDPRYDDDGDLTFEYVSERIGALLDGWSNKSFASKTDAAAFGRTMVEHVLALEPTAVELESTRCKLIDFGSEFMPQTPKVLAVLREEQKLWSRRKQAIMFADWYYREIVEVIPAAKAKAAKAKAEAEALRARKQAEYDAQRARWKAEEEACKADAELEAACRKIEAEEKAIRRAEETIENAYSNGLGMGRNSKLPLEWLVKHGLLSFRDSWMCDDCIVAYALGLFEARRGLRKWDPMLTDDQSTKPVTSSRRKRGTARATRTSPKVRKNDDVRRKKTP